MTSVEVFISLWGCIILACTFGKWMIEEAQTENTNFVLWTFIWAVFVFACIFVLVFALIYFVNVHLL